jgi:hypothetical protein
MEQTLVLRMLMAGRGLFHTHAVSSLVSPRITHSQRRTCQAMRPLGSIA